VVLVRIGFALFLLAFSTLRVYPPEANQKASGVTPIPPPVPIVCPCALGGDLVDWVQTKCLDEPNYTGSPPRNPAPTCVPPPASPAYLFMQCEPGGVFPPQVIAIWAVNTSAETCDFVYGSCPGPLPCTPQTDYDSGELSVTPEEKAVCDALILDSGYCE